MLSTILFRMLQFPLLGKLRDWGAAPLFQSLLIRNQSYRIPFGPLRGLRLTFSEGVCVQELLGLADYRQLQILSRLVRSYFASDKELVVVDAGANVGLYSMWFSTVLKLQIKKIYAFEPSPTTLRTIQKNLEQNGFDRVEVIPSALADTEGEMEFVASGDPHTSHLKMNALREEKVFSPSSYVPTTTLDHFFSEKGRSLPHLLKIDIEGGAALAFQSAERCLANRPLIFIESHNHDEDSSIRSLLFRHRYVAYRLNDERWVSHPKEIHPHPSGVWGRLVLVPLEKMEAALPILKEKRNG